MQSVIMQSVALQAEIMKQPKLQWMHTRADQRMIKIFFFYEPLVDYLLSLTSQLIVTDRISLLIIVYPSKLRLHANL